MENEITVIEQTALTWPEKAKAIAVIDQQSYDIAVVDVKQIAQVKKAITEHYGPLKKAAQDSHKKIVAAEKQFLDPLDEADRIIRQSITRWSQEQERIRIEAQRKVEAEARAKEEQERLAKAVQAEEMGVNPVIVEKILETPKPIEPVITAPTFQKAAGIASRETWRAEVTDIKALCQSIVDGKIQPEAVSPNMAVLNGLARSFKDDLNIPGIKAVKETGIRVG